MNRRAVTANTGCSWPPTVRVDDLIDLDLDPENGLLELCGATRRARPSWFAAYRACAAVNKRPLPQRAPSLRRPILYC